MCEGKMVLREGIFLGKSKFSNVYTIFPFFKDIRTEETNALLVSKILPKGTAVFNEGDQCSGVAFVLKGSIRVSKVGKSGREVILYRVGSGNSCVLTIASVLSNISYPATATVEEDVEVILVPVQLFKAMMTSNLELQQFVYKLISERLLNVLSLIDEIIFRKIDERLIEFLLKKALKDGDIIEMTHEELSIQLGTAREVISRIMKGFERDGCIQLSRGKVRIINRLCLEERLSTS